MKIRVVIAAVALASAGGGALGNEAAKTPQTQGQQLAKTGASGAEQPAAAPAPENVPAKVTVSDRSAPNGGADGRVSVGGVMISRARFDVRADASAPAGRSAGSGGSREDGLIDVPSNTLGAGESLQQRNDRIAAENRRVLAEASIAEREAARPAPRTEDRETFIVFGHGTRGVWYGGGYGGDWGGGWYGRPRVAITTETIGFENEANGRALKHYSDAAGAAIIDAGGLQREAVLNFGKASTPPLIEQQNQRDQAQINLRKPPQPAGK